MSEQSMIERVARAIKQLVPVDYGMREAEAEAYARAAIATMREPTVEMELAGMNADLELRDEEAARKEAAAQWRAMIDEALRDE